LPIVCHLITASNDPSHGGMQETVDRVATRLAAAGNITVIVYTSNPALQVPETPYQVEDLSEEEQFLTSPLVEAARSQCVPFNGLSAESFQVRRLLLKARIEAALDARPDDRHVLISFFLTKFGFTAQLIAKELGLPHVACVAGSDLNRDVASPSGMASAAFVIANAEWIVVRSHEQARRIERLFDRSHNVSVYSGGLPAGRPKGIWERNGHEHVSLVSDCGYSFKKSTHTLVGAFRRLLTEGYPVTLRIVGQTPNRERTHWEAARREWRAEFGERASFCQHVNKDEVECMLLHGGIYCSASLGEGSPNGALYALALGMPIVAPQSCSLEDVSDLASDRVSLFRAGDRRDFYNRLAAMVALVRGNLRPLDPQRIASIRRSLSEDESRKWLNVVRHAATA